MASQSLMLVWGLALSCWNNISRWFLSGRTLETLPHFVQCADIRIWVKCHSSLHHIKENHSRTVPEHHDHHVSGWWRTSRSCAFSTSQSLALFFQRPTVLLSTSSVPWTLQSRLWVFRTVSFTEKRNCYHSTLFVTVVTGRLLFEELQQRCLASESSTNFYIEWGNLKCVLPEITAF
jgi:hypothetical protein